MLVSSFPTLLDASLLDQAAVHNSGLRGVVVVAVGSLEGLDDLLGLLICHLAKNNVLTIEPTSDDGGDEELGAVAAG